MVWLGLLLLCLAQIPASTPLPSVPEAPGVYFLQNNKEWINLQPAVIQNANAKGIGLFVETEGYTNQGMDVICRGSRASVRFSLQKPTLYIRGIAQAKDAELVRLTQKKDSREFKTSFSNVTVQNKGGFRKQDLYNLEATNLPDGSLSIVPEKDLPPGEYLLAFGSAATAYDFGIDKTK